MVDAMDVFAPGTSTPEIARARVALIGEWIEEYPEDMEMVLKEMNIWEEVQYLLHCDGEVMSAEDQLEAEQH